MGLGKFSDWPESKATTRLLLISIGIIGVLYPFMGFFFFSSGYPVDFMTSQLSFSGATLKAHYAVTIIDIYRIAQILDYIFMVGYGCLSFSLALIIARSFEEDSKWRNTGYRVAIMGPIAACLDAIENAFILAMLTDPLGFPDIWAITHSCFALVKYIFLLSCIGWAVSATITKVTKK